MTIEKRNHEQIATRRVLNEAPRLIYSPNDMRDVLAQVISVDRSTGKLVNVGEYVSRNLPSQAFNLRVIPEVRIDPFPQPNELDVNELAKLSGDFFRGTDENLVDQDGFSPKHVIGEIKKRSPKGLEEMRIVAQDRQFFVDLISRGKMRVDENVPDVGLDVEFPDFPY